jgi:hypothetical protein
MKKLLLTVAGLIALCAQATAQDALQMQQMQRATWGNELRQKQANPRVETNSKAVDREYNAALKKIPDQKKSIDPWAGVRSGEPTKK